MSQMSPEIVDHLPGHHEVEQTTLVKIVAPLAALAAAAAVRRLLDSGYRRVTGSAPPRANDRSVPMSRVLLWAATTAAAVAVATVVVDRLTAPREE